jgi:CBS domain-containing protein
MPCFQGGLVDDIARFLSQHVPWQELSPERVAAVARRLQIEYFPRGARVVPAGVVPDHLVVVRSGSAGTVPAAGQPDAHAERFGEGDAFDADALWRRVPAAADVVAREDLLAYLVPREVLAGLAGLPCMAAFLAGTPGGRLRRSLDERSAGSFVDTRVGDLANAPPLACPPQTPVREAARLMAAAHMSSILVPGAPCGIVTDRDLRTRVLAAGLDPDTPVSAVATAPMVVIAADARVMEALALVMERGVHHLPVEKDGEPVGVVTVTDLLRLQSRSPLLLGRVLERTRSAADVEGWSRQVGPALAEMAQAGVPAAAIGRLAALAADALVRRLVEPWTRATDLPPFCWLALGDLGRMESAWPPEGGALVAWEDGDDAAGARLAAHVASASDVLARLVSARQGNDATAAPPATCMPWGALDPPDRMAPGTLAALLDARPVAGTADAGARLAAIARDARTRPVATALLARIPRPPAAWCADGVVEPDGTRPDALDVVARVVRPIRDMARLAALLAAVPACPTPERLQAAGDRGILDTALAADLASAHAWAAGWAMQRRRPATEAGGGTGSADRALVRDCFGLVRAGLSALAAAIAREDGWTR